MEPIEYQRKFELEERHWWFQGRLELIRKILDQHAPKTLTFAGLHFID